jgi:hypothetical protein
VVIVLSFRLIEGGGALNAASPPGAQPEGLGFLISKASNRSLDELSSLRFGDIEEAQTQRLGSIAQCALRGQVLDPLLLTERGTRTVIHGMDMQQFEHRHIVVHGSIPKYVGK